MKIHLRENHLAAKLKYLANASGEEGVVLVDSDEKIIGVMLDPKRYELMMSLIALAKKPSSYEKILKKNKDFADGKNLDAMKFEEVFVVKDSDLTL